MEKENVKGEEERRKFCTLPYPIVITKYIGHQKIL